MGQHLKPKVLKALQGSIKKWEDILTGKIAERGANNCPLCQMFVVKTGECDGCPVYKNTGEESCEGTPYTEHWRGAEREAGASGASRIAKEFALTDRQIVAARKELDYLRSLLPKRLQIKRPS